MRNSLALLSAMVVVLLGAPAGAGAANTFAGTWDSDFGQLTLDAGGSGPYQGFSPGTVTGHVTGNVDEGTWQQPGNPPKQGTFKFTLGFDGRSFTGVWQYDTGGCGNACGWNGHCVSGPCMTNGTASTPSTAPPTRRPALGATTSYTPPKPGGTSSYPLPTVPAGKQAVTGTFRFIDDQGREVSGPDIAAVQARAEDATALCYLLAFNPEFGEGSELDLSAFATCVHTVARVLARADDIKRRRGQQRAASGAHAAGAGCTVFSATKARSRLLRVGCRKTARGLRVTFTRRSKRTSLRKALRLQKPKIVVTRSALLSQSKVARLEAHWSAR